MGHTYYSVYEHITFSTKNRRPWLTDEVMAELFPYLAQALTNQGCKCLKVGGHREHVHLLVRKNNTLLTGELVKELKRLSTKWMKAKDDSVDGFSWQQGYGAFSVSYSQVPRVSQYIACQMEHHHEMSWEDEFRQLLDKHGIEYDQRYLLG